MKIDKIDAYCVHLIKRKDREPNMYKELNRFTDNWEVFEAIKRPKGHEGTSASFRKIISKAKSNRLKQILIFEDDIKFTSEKSKEKFQKAIDSLPNDWDILLGGVYSLLNKKDLEVDPINDHLRKIGDFASLHCILIRDTAYDKILDHPNSRVKHLDRYIGSLAKNGKLNVYLTYPMVAVQYNTFSDNINTQVNYDGLLNKFEVLRD